MDPRLLDYYNAELRFCASRARNSRTPTAHRGAAGMDSLEVADPYVERLIEAFAFWRRACN